MYLNIINNIRQEGKRKNKKIDYSFEDEKNNSSQISNDNDSFTYYSVFYGDLTKNWIKLKD